MELSRYRYCTVFVVEGNDLDPDELERELEPIGDSLLVVGDSSALKVHVHTDDPGRALSLGVARGVVEGVEIANMHAQTQERERGCCTWCPMRRRPRRLSSPSRQVTESRSLRERRRSRRRRRRTMNPSTADLVAAIEAAPTPEVVVLPTTRT